MLTHLAFVGGRVTVALAALNAGASAFTVGVLASLFAVVPMLLAVSMGRLVDRIGVRGPMTVGAAGMAAGWALAFFLPQLAILFVASTVVGTAFMFFHIAANHAAGTMSPPALCKRRTGGSDRGERNQPDSDVLALIFRPEQHQIFLDQGLQQAACGWNLETQFGCDLCEPSALLGGCGDKAQGGNRPGNGLGALDSCDR